MPSFMIRKKAISIGDDSWVEDEAGEKVLHVDGKAMRLRDTYVIETPDGREVLRIKEQRLKLRTTYAIERQGEQVATVAKALVTPLHDRFDIEVAGGGAVQAKGDLTDHEFTVAWENGTPMAEVSKRWFKVRDTWGVSVEPGQDDVLAIAITICIDAIQQG